MPRSLRIAARVASALPLVVAIASLGSVGCGDAATGAALGGVAPRGGGSTGAPPGSGASGGGDTRSGASGGSNSSDGDDGGPSASTSDDAGAPGSPGAAAGDGGSGGPSPAPPSCKDLPICDDFEGATPGGPPSAAIWSVVTPSCSGTGALAIDGAVAHRGSRSVKVSGAGGYCNHVFFASTKVAAIGAQVWGRFFVRFDQALGAGHTAFLAMKDTEDGKDLRMGGQNQVLMWNRESDDATLPAMSPAGTAKSVAPKPGQWTCIELEVDGAAGTIHTWVDGAAVEGMTAVPPAIPDVSAQWLSKAGFRPALADVKLGWESYAGQADTLWFDDVAFAAQRIGCGG